MLRHGSSQCPSICTSQSTCVQCRGGSRDQVEAVADPGGRGGHGPPGPVKIGHKKDGCQRWLHRFHVSRPPLTRPLDPLLRGTWSPLSVQYFSCSFRQKIWYGWYPLWEILDLPLHSTTWAISWLSCVSRFSASLWLSVISNTAPPLLSSAFITDCSL